MAYKTGSSSDTNVLQLDFSRARRQLPARIQLSVQNLAQISSAASDAMGSYRCADRRHHFQGWRWRLANGQCGRHFDFRQLRRTLRSHQCSRSGSYRPNVLTNADGSVRLSLVSRIQVQPVRLLLLTRRTTQIAHDACGHNQVRREYRRLASRPCRMDIDATVTVDGVTANQRIEHRHATPSPESRSNCCQPEPPQLPQEPAHRKACR